MQKATVHPSGESGLAGENPARGLGALNVVNDELHGIVDGQAPRRLLLGDLLVSRERAQSLITNLYQAL
jgi:hypothetical protein